MDVRSSQILPGHLGSIDFVLRAFVRSLKMIPGSAFGVVTNSDIRTIPPDP